MRDLRRQSLRWSGRFVAVLGLVLGFSGMAQADEVGAGDDATITVIADGEMPDDVVNLIELPRHATPPGPAGGISTATQAQQDATESGRAFGQSVADEARDRGIGAAVREEAKQQARDESNPGNAHRGPPPH
jgi:hypothetical protein